MCVGNMEFKSSLGSESIPRPLFRFSRNSRLIPRSKRFLVFNRSTFMKVCNGPLLKANIFSIQIADYISVWLVTEESNESNRHTDITYQCSDTSLYAILRVSDLLQVQGKCGIILSSECNPVSDINHLKKRILTLFLSLMVLLVMCVS